MGLINSCDAGRPPGSRLGLSLLEALLAVAILGLVLPVFLGGISSQGRVSERAGAHQFATATARRIIERTLQCEFPVLVASCGRERAITEEALAGFAQVTGKNTPRHTMHGTLHLERVNPDLIRIQVRLETQEGGTRPASRVELVRYVSDPADGGTGGEAR